MKWHITPVFGIGDRVTSALRSDFSQVGTVVQVTLINLLLSDDTPTDQWIFEYKVAWDGWGGDLATCYFPIGIRLYDPVEAAAYRANLVAAKEAYDRSL